MYASFVLFFWVFAYRPCPAMKGVQLISAPKPTMHNLFTDMAGVSDDQVDRKLGCVYIMYIVVCTYIFLSFYLYLHTGLEGVGGGEGWRPRRGTCPAYVCA